MSENVQNSAADSERTRKITQWVQNVVAYENGDLFPLPGWPLPTITKADRALVDKLYGKPLTKPPVCGLAKQLETMNQ